MKYYYQLDNYNRFTCLEPEGGIIPESWNWPFLELDDISNIIIGQHALINNEILFIGVQEVEIKESEKQDKIHRVNKLKKLLQKDDYKVIKCYEAQLANEEMPYDLQQLLAQRKAWREEINQLEFEIAMLG
jgi:hypothetical protein